MTKTASKDLMEELHALLAGAMKDQIQKCKDDKEPIPPQLMSNIIKFLKDNKIESLDAEGSPLAGLTEALPFPTDNQLRNLQ